jgi:hypothetical protein
MSKYQQSNAYGTQTYKIVVVGSGGVGKSGEFRDNDSLN